LLRDDICSVKGRLTSVDARLAIVHTNIVATLERLDRMESRLDQSLSGVTASRISGSFVCRPKQNRRTGQQENSQTQGSGMLCA